MKRFAFSLERVRQWREEQLAIESLRLERLFAEKSLIEQSWALLEREASESAATVSRVSSFDAVELQAVDAFRRHVIAQRALFAARLADCERRIEAQQRQVMEARRKCELLARLKERKWKTWSEELARELELQASEVYLAKWNAGQR